MKESEFQSDLIKSLTKRGALIFNIHGHAMQKKGWPDLFVGHSIWSGFIELKVWYNKPKQHQKMVLADLFVRGVKVCWISMTRNESVEVYTCGHTGSIGYDGVATCILSSSLPWYEIRQDGRVLLEELSRVT